MKAANIHIGQHYAAALRGRPNPEFGLFNVEVLEKIETAPREQARFVVQRIARVASQWRVVKWADHSPVTLKADQFYRSWSDYLKEVEKHRERVEQYLAEDARAVEKALKEQAEEEERRKVMGPPAKVLSPKIISEQQLEVEEYRRVSREERGWEGDTVRIYRSPAGWYVVWGNVAEIDFTTMEPDEYSDSLEAATGWADDCFFVRPDTVEVWARIPREELIEKLIPRGAFLHETVDVNGEPWELGPTIPALHGHGEKVFAHAWEGGMGEYGRYVYSLEGEYYAYDAFDAENERLSVPMGPYDTLEQAIRYCGFHQVGSATSRVRSEELTREELIDLLVPDGTYRGQPVSVNGEPWTPS